jgi:hypothetical protein
MLPGDRFGVESRAHHVRRRLLSLRRSRAERFAPADWPRSRGPTPRPTRN